MRLPRRGLALLLMSVLAAACGAPAPTPSAEATPTATPPATPIPASETPTASIPATASPSPTIEPIANEPPALGLETVAAGLVQPVGIATGPPGWLLVHERAGRIVAVELDSGATSVVVDLSDRVLADATEQGLLGLALHPGWPEEDRAFVHYSDGNGDTVLSEFRAADGEGGAPALDPSSERVLLRVDQPFTNHNGGQLAFGPEDYLWFGLGDGGFGGDPLGNGQNRFALLGKILRLDVDGDAEGDAAYAIPDDNPYADGADGAAEAYFFGLRNPWRFSFDRATDELWIADVGQNAFEEVDRIDVAEAPGANFGWNRMEASHCYLGGCSSDGLVLPVAEYGRDLGWETAPGPRVLLETGANVTSFGIDTDGELYLVDIASGTLYRIVAAS
jgi:glucose/arabinose dehydrogenase